MPTPPTPDRPVPSAGAVPAAVLWDMDGTLVDTEPVWWAAERALVEAHGGTWSDEQALALVGSQLEVSAEVLRVEGGVDLPVPEVIEVLAASVVADLVKGPRWRPGARELVAELAEAGVPQALVTMSWRHIADAMLGHLPEGTFAAVVTGDVCERGKPHPEPYLRAAAALGLRPEDCLAVEDSPTGVASAAAAGVPVVAVPHAVVVPARPGVAVVGSLAGMSTGDLAEVRRGVLDAEGAPPQGD